MSKGKNPIQPGIGNTATNIPNSPLVIKDFQKGIAQSPHLGFGDMRNLNILYTPGVAKINRASSKISGSVVTDVLNWIVYDSIYSGIWAIDQSHNFYGNYPGGSFIKLGNPNSGAGQGLQVFKNYISVANGTTLKFWGPISGTSGTGTISTSGTAVTGSGTSFTTQLAAGDTISASGQVRIVSSITDNTHLTVSSAFSPDISGQNFSFWHWYNFQNLQSGSYSYNPMIVSKNDGILYIGNGKYLSSLAEVAGSTFDPSNSATYKWTSQALTLPDHLGVAAVRSLTDFGTKLAMVLDSSIGGLVYNWDRTSPSFDAPVQIAEPYLLAVACLNNALIIFAPEGRIYVSDGINASFAAQIPVAISQTESGKAPTVLPGAITLLGSKLFFGLSLPNGGDGAGMWSLSLQGKNYVLQHENAMSTGTMSSLNSMRISAAVAVSPEQFYFGWQDNTSYGVDQVQPGSRYSSYVSYFESPFYIVGSKLRKRQFKKISFQLAKYLASGHGIKLKYRVNLSDSFTTIGTYDYATYSAIDSFSDNINIPECEKIQIRGELTTSGSGTPELLNVTLF